MLFLFVFSFIWFVLPPIRGTHRGKDWNRQPMKHLLRICVLPGAVGSPGTSCAQCGTVDFLRTTGKRTSGLKAFPAGGDNYNSRPLQDFPGYCTGQQKPGQFQMRREGRAWLKLAGEGGMTSSRNPCTGQFPKLCTRTFQEDWSRFLIGWLRQEASVANEIAIKHWVSCLFTVAHPTL